MNRLMSIVALGVLLVLPPSIQTAEPAKDKKEKKLVSQPSEWTRLREMAAKLDQPITLEKGFEANASLKEALEFLSEKQNIEILIDEHAFSAETDQQEVRSQPIKMKKVTNVPFRAVLRMLLKQLDATFIVYPSYIEVVPHRGIRTPITASFERQPLSQALRELAIRSNQTIILDSPTDGESTPEQEIPVTALFTDVPLEGAVRCLASMAELQVVQMDQNLLYVTSAKKAEEINGEAERRQEVTPNGVGGFPMRLGGLLGFGEAGLGPSLKGDQHWVGKKAKK